MGQDRLLEAAQRCPGLEPKLADEQTSPFLIRLKRLGLPTAAVEGEHELAAQSLAQRMLGKERLQLGDEGRVASERKLGFDPLLDRAHPELPESQPFRVGERRRVEVRQRRPAPERERLREQRRCTLRIAVGKRLAPLSREPLEAAEVDFATVELEDVAGSAGEDTVRAKRLPQPRDVALQGGRCRLGGTIAPDVVDQAVARDDLVRMQDEQRQERALLRPAQRRDAAVVFDLERAEDPELHARVLAEKLTPFSGFLAFL